MRQIYYKSDFDFELRVYDSEGRDIGIPPYDWELELWTEGNRANSYIASFKGGEFVNARENDAGRAQIYVQGHRLGEGELRGELRVGLIEEHYAERKKTEYAIGALGITLSRSESEMTIDSAGEQDEDTGGEMQPEAPEAGVRTFYVDKRIRRGCIPFKPQRGICYYADNFIKIKRGVSFIQMSSAILRGEIKDWAETPWRLEHIGKYPGLYVAEQGGVDKGGRLYDVTSTLESVVSEGANGELTFSINRLKLESITGKSITWGDKNRHGLTFFFKLRADNGGANSDIVYLRESGKMEFADSSAIGAREYDISLTDRGAIASIREWRVEELSAAGGWRFWHLRRVRRSRLRGATGCLRAAIESKMGL